jgi:hypothetical protein
MRDLPAPKSAAPPNPLEAARARPPPEVAPALIPDGCNLGTLLRVSLGVNVAALIGTLAVTSESGQFGAVFLSTAAVLEPVTLLTLLAWCALRRLLPPLPPARSAAIQRALAWAVPAVVAYGVLRLLLGPGEPVNRTVWAGAAVARCWRGGAALPGAARSRLLAGDGGGQAAGVAVAHPSALSLQ